MRAFNCLLASAGVLVGAYLTWVAPRYFEPLLTAAAAFLVCAAGNIINDVVDIRADRINHPNRLLARGEIRKEHAVRLAVCFNVMSLILGLLVNLAVFVSILLAVALLALYNYKAKQVPIIGNLIVAFIGGLTFIAGGLSIDTILTFTLPGPLIPAAFAFLFHLAREIVKDVEDIEGDRQFGLKTLPQIVGVSRALLVALAVFFMFSVISFVPVVSGWFGRSYEIIAVYLIDLPTLLLLILVWGNPTPKMLRAGSTVLKGGMVLGILALILAR
jgi:geranylgeranylglycerol-phosphate geranylgeranyltransferase